MPAPSIFDLYDFEGQIEAAAQAALVAMIAGVTPALPAIQVTVSRDSDTQVTPRFELMFATGEPILQYGAFGQANPKQVPVAFQGTLTVLVVTTRPFDNSAAAPFHGIMRGLARYCFSSGAKALNDTSLPYIQILELLPTGLRPQLQENKEQDIDALQFLVKFAVRNEAWPVGA